MLYLAFIFHMHQPYYKNLLTQEADLPWVRLHGTKDYLDMVEILQEYPSIHQTFNIVPSLFEQIEDYANHKVKDKFLEFSYKPAKELTSQEKAFIIDNFFSVNKRIISVFPRYYELYFKKQEQKEFSLQDYLDLQVLFNLSWIDPYFRQNMPDLKNLLNKARFFSEEEKQSVLNKQLDILKEIIPTYKKFMQNQQIELSISPYYHPILPLLYNIKTTLEANPKSRLPKTNFSYPQDAQNQINQAVEFYKHKFNAAPQGMWPSEQSVSEHILPFIIQAGLNWIVTDEVILFKSLRKKKRDAQLIYQPYLLNRKEGDLNIVFRDRSLSDLISFVYHSWKTEAAVDDLLKHFRNIYDAFKNQDILVTIAMDGENAWEYYPNDGIDFLRLLYQRLSEAKFIRIVTVSEYLKLNPAKFKLGRLAAGSWIYGNFGKWIDNSYKAKAWEYLSFAREELEKIKSSIPNSKLELAYKQIYVAEGSDWFWWYGENHNDFDILFRMHLSNFYSIIGKDVPLELKKPLSS